MKKLLFVTVILSLLFIKVSLAEMTETQKAQVISEYRYLKGLGPKPPSLEGVDHLKCGTTIAAGFSQIKDQLTGKMAVEAELLQGRPGDLPETYDSPQGYFKIHYTISGPATVYQYDIDTIPAGAPDGIPDYVNKVAEIADSVYDKIIVELGYMVPPPDGIAGGDEKYDIYLDNLPSQYYGYAEDETRLNAQRYTSFLVLDNDYSGISPYGDSPLMNRRLDAARVTLAHEYFHAVHFGIDHSEYQYDSFWGYIRPWWEMSAVWMEETVYDDINDYYYYIPAFYDYPWHSLQAPGASTLHQYGAGIFVMYLSQKLGVDIVKDIWYRCRDYGLGEDWLNAVNDAVDSLSGGAYDLRRIFNEFMVANYFSGDRISQAPPGYSLQEAENFYTMPEDVIITFNQYQGSDMICPNWPDTLADGSDLTFFSLNRPQSLGGHYLKMNNVSLFSDSLFTYSLFGSPSIRWDYSIIAFRLGSSIPEIIYRRPGYNPVLEGDSLIELNFRTDEYSRMILVVTPGDTSTSKYPSKYCYSVNYKDSSIITIDDQFVIRSPYPNPVLNPSDDDSLTFRATINTDETGGVSARLRVSIFNVAGEKVNEIENIAYDTYRNGDIVALGWHYDNESTAKVTPGVYMALCELKFADGRAPVMEKFKIALIK